MIEVMALPAATCMDLRLVSARPLPPAASVVATQQSGARMIRTIERSIFDLGHHLGCRVTAEGVEGRAPLDYLVGDHAQGYFIAEPMRSDAFDRFIDEGAWPRCREANA